MSEEPTTTQSPAANETSPPAGTGGESVPAAPAADPRQAALEILQSDPERFSAEGWDIEFPDLLEEGDVSEGTPETAALTAEDLALVDDPADADGEEGEADVEVADDDARESDDETEAEAEGDQTTEGVPATPEGYDLAAAFGDAEDLVAKEFAGVAHELGLAQDDLAKVGEWYKGVVAAHEEEQAEADKVAAEQTRTALRDAWGAETFSEHRTRVKDWLEAMPNNAGTLIRQARMGDGSLALNNPAIFRALAIAAASDANAATPASRIAQIEETLRRGELNLYRRQGMDVELRQLLIQQEQGQDQTKPLPVTGDADTRRIKQLDALLATDRGEYFRRGGSEEMRQLLARQEKKRGTR